MEQPVYVHELYNWEVVYMEKHVSFKLWSDKKKRK
jgi:hypothetical protein